MNSKPYLYVVNSNRDTKESNDLLRMLTKTWKDKTFFLQFNDCRIAVEKGVEIDVDVDDALVLYCSMPDISQCKVLNYICKPNSFVNIIEGDFGFSSVNASELLAIEYQKK